MFSTDMLLTTIILMGCLSVLAESAVRCNAGDKRTTIRVESDFRQLPLKRSFSNVKIITSNKAFQSRSNEYARAQENYDSMDTSASASGSYGRFSASVSAAYSSVSQSASSMSSASSSSTSGESYSETENTEEREYFEGQNQIMRDIKTTVIIDGIAAVVEEQEIFTARSVDNPMTIPELRQLAIDYINNMYGDVAEGTISGGGTIFEQTRCYKTPTPEPTPAVWHPRVRNAYISLPPVPISVKTNSVLGSNEAMFLWFSNEQDNAGAITLSFTTPMKYQIHFCMNNLAPLPVTPPASRDKIWKISVTALPRVVVLVECNGVEVLNIQLSDGLCSHYRSEVWRYYWGKSVSRVKFFGSNDAADAYCVGNNCA